MSGIPAGELNRAIVIEAKGATVNELNEPVANWTVWATVWSMPRGQTGMGVVRSSVEGAAPLNAYSYRIRYRPDIPDTTLRINDDGAFLDITDIRHDVAGHDWTDLICRAGGNPDA